jgi:DNA-binding transcriptional ArsR family regulator
LLGALEHNRMDHLDPHTIRQLKQALSHPARQAILGYLLGSGEPMSEGDLARLLDLGEAKVTYHLTVLRQADLVMQTEEGQEPGLGEREYLAAGMAGR